MQFLKSRHIKVAMFVGPVLAVVAYVAVDRSLAVPPLAAVAGQSYRLAQQPNCRYTSGVCTLHNGDVEIQIRAKRLSRQEVEVQLASRLPIQSALVSLGSNQEFDAPIRFSQKLPPTARLQLSDTQQLSLRWAIGILESTYFAETPSVFVDRDTAFPQHNFSGDQ